MKKKLFYRAYNVSYWLTNYSTLSVKQLAGGWFKIGNVQDKLCWLLLSYLRDVIVVLMRQLGCIKCKLNVRWLCLSQMKNV